MRPSSTVHVSEIQKTAYRTAEGEATATTGTESASWKTIWSTWWTGTWKEMVKVMDWLLWLL